MTYTVRHKLLTLYGSGVNTPAEAWQCSVRLLPAGTTAVSQAQADACRAAAVTMFGTAFVSMKSTHNFIGCKLAPIGIDGLYPRGEIAYDSVGTPVVGAGSAGDPLPWQTAYAVSLDTAVPRGRAHEGRMFLPVLQGTIGTDGLLTTGRVDQVLGGVRTFLLALNAITDLGQVAIFSQIGTGTTNVVTGLRGGRVFDTQRSRRRQLVEGYRTLAL